MSVLTHLASASRRTGPRCDTRFMGRRSDTPAAWRGSLTVIAVLGMAVLVGCGGGGSGGGSQPPADTMPPTVPQGVTASAASTTQITVSWQAATDAGTGVAGYARVPQRSRERRCNPVRHLVHRRRTHPGDPVLVHRVGLRRRHPSQRVGALRRGNRNDEVDDSDRGARRATRQHDLRRRGPAVASRVSCHGTRVPEPAGVFEPYPDAAGTGRRRALVRRRAGRHGACVR